MRSVAAVLTDPRSSPLLHTLFRAVPQITERLADESVWRGIRVLEPDSRHEYTRVVCNDELVAGQSSLLVAVHLFEMDGYAGTLHDHRWPLAVLPFGVAAGAETLYEMPWERRDAEQTVASGLLLIHEQQGWAIEDFRNVRHAVRSLRPHLSLSVTDITQPPNRDNRMVVAPMTPTDIARVLRIAREVTARSRR